MSLKGAVVTYFLRVYAEERQKRVRCAGWGAFGEAVFQTTFIFVIPMFGLAAGGIVLLEGLSRSAHDWLIAYRTVVTISVGTVPLLISFLIVRSVVWKYRGSHADLLSFGTTHDRSVINLQFWSVLAASLAVPWFAAAIMRVAG